MLKIWDDESYGMERNMNRSTSEVMRNSRPIKMDENMRNIKVEGDNSFSFVSTFFSVLGRIMINKAAFNILEYCDGDNSVQDICHLLNTKYDIDEDIIYKDVDKTLQLFWRLKVIKMTGENYLLDRFVYISDKLKIKYLQYEELLDLVSNIDSLKDSLVIAEEGLGLLNNEYGIMESRIKNLREKRGIIQEILAAELGITQQMLSKYEKDVTVIKVDILKRLAEYFNVTTDYLLGMSDVKRDLTGQIKLNETLDEYYDMIEVYKTLDQYDQELVWSLLQIVRKNEEKKKKDRENDKCSNL